MSDAPVSLILEFDGWCMIRQPTDPDPYDERRGVSGYTFAFGDEPDLNRVIYMQPSPDSPARSHGPPHGVFIRKAQQVGKGDPRPIPELEGATFDLLDEPVLENRNWALTLPGYEPITPFHIRIESSSPSLVIDRNVPLDPDKPDLPAWKLDEDVLVEKGARGLALEPETVGRATGLWDFLQAAVDRRAALEKDLKALEKKTKKKHEAKRAILRGRIAELTYAIEHPKDRRLLVRAVIERFGFPLTGSAASVDDPDGVLGGTLATSASATWRIDFWMGAWDADALSCFVEGALSIPYTSS